MSFLKGIRELWDHLRGKGPAAAVALTLDLSEARDNKPYMLEAGAVFVERCDGDLYARVNGPNGDGINLQYVKKILYPVSSLYLTNAVQAGKSARLLLLPTGMDADPPAPTGAVAAYDKCRVYKTAGQTFLNDIEDYVTWDAEFLDTNNMHDNVSNNTRITIKRAGYYLCIVVLVWSPSGTGQRGGYFIKNGVTPTAMLIVNNCGASVATVVQGIYFDYFNVDDFVEVVGWQNSGGNLALLGTSTGSWFGVFQMP